jgi:hypothetical protein
LVKLLRCFTVKDRGESEVFNADRRQDGDEPGPEPTPLQSRGSFRVHRRGFGDAFEHHKERCPNRVGSGGPISPMCHLYEMTLLSRLSRATEQSGDDLLLCGKRAQEFQALLP